MKNKLFLLVVSGLCFACSSSSDSTSPSDPPGQSNGGDTPTNAQWSIPISEVLDGGPGKDGIPALINPDLVSIGAIDFLSDDDLVIGFKNGDDVRAYPHAILDWHEIINDNIGDVSVAVTYCPLTGTGIGWSRLIDSSETTFGVSGLLYNTNLIPYDRVTDSNWSQILNESVNGSLIGTLAETITLFETNWKTWKTLYPDSKIVGRNTGFSRTYGVSPYGDYNTNNNRFLFPVPKDSRLPSKERVHAILGGGDQAKVYRFTSFDSQQIISDVFQGKEYLIVGNANFMVSFEMPTGKTVNDFTYIHTGGELLFADNEGNQWNVFGEALSGPDTGSFMVKSKSMMGMWFSIPSFYATEIYGQ